MVVLVLSGQLEILQKIFARGKIVREKMGNIHGGPNVVTGMAILVNQILLWVILFDIYLDSREGVTKTLLEFFEKFFGLL